MKTNSCQSCEQNKHCPCPDCKENKPPRCEELEHKFGLKKWIFRFIFLFVVIGFMGPFIAQCWLSVGIPNLQIDGLSMWNQYVGIVLGIVATILSIVSLIMGFYSSNEAYQQQRKAFEQYEATIALLHKVETDVADVKSKVGKNTDPEHVAPIAPNEATMKAEEIE